MYGVYLAEHNKALFEDDTPKVWTYGPVFPRPNKKVVSCEKIVREDFTKEQIEAFQKDKSFLSRIVSIVGKMCHKSAFELSQWSHEEGSPWYTTLYEKNSDDKIINQKPWNTPISDNTIKEYFSKAQNAIFG